MQNILKGDWDKIVIETEDGAIPIAIITDSNIEVKEGFAVRLTPSNQD